MIGVFVCVKSFKDIALHRIIAVFVNFVNQFPKGVVGSFFNLLHVFDAVLNGPS